MPTNNKTYKKKGDKEKYKMLNVKMKNVMKFSCDEKCDTEDTPAPPCLASACPTFSISVSLPWTFSGSQSSASLLPEFEKCLGMKALLEQPSINNGNLKIPNSNTLYQVHHNLACHPCAGAILSFSVSFQFLVHLLLKWACSNAQSFWRASLL